MLIHFPKEWIVEVRSSGSYFHTFLSFFFFFFQFYRPGDSTPARKEGDIGGLSTPHYDKSQHSKGSTNNFVSPNTVGLKSETPHTAQFEITARVWLLIGVHEYQKKSATPQHRKSKCPTP